MPKTILVADDEPYVLRSLEFILKKEGYRVLTATDGQDALEKIRQELPDLVFLDIQMPRMDGNTLCQTLRKEPTTRDLRIIMITAKGQEADRLQALESGADEFITKPYSPRKLVERVREILGPSA
ncbi:MAG: response regulator transcription factor [Candidatus Xenobium sp.]|jgi:DNA-binding response OmpR family regulator|nr:response regulator [Burkholderiales bacterium]